jgi:hypothetical protein
MRRAASPQQPPDIAAPRIVPVLLTVTLIMLAVIAVGQTHRRRFLMRGAALPDELQTWEGEGGQPIDPA